MKIKNFMHVKSDRQLNESDNVRTIVHVNALIIVADLIEDLTQRNLKQAENKEQLCALAHTYGSLLKMLRGELEKIDGLQDYELGQLLLKRLETQVNFFDSDVAKELDDCGGIAFPFFKSNGGDREN